MTEPITWTEPDLDDMQVEKLFKEWNALFVGRQREVDHQMELDKKN